MNIYDINIQKNNGEEISLSQYKGKILLIVNTASKCGLTPQYEELEILYQLYKNKNFEILAFPCNQFGNQETGSNDEIQSFCKLNYGVTFPVFSKIDVNGYLEHPLFKYLKEQKRGIFGKNIKRNFTKFLIDIDGKVLYRFSPITKPMKIKSYIEKIINK